MSPQRGRTGLIRAITYDFFFATRLINCRARDEQKGMRIIVSIYPDASYLATIIDVSCPLKMERGTGRNQGI